MHAYLTIIYKQLRVFVYICRDIDTYIYIHRYKHILIHQIGLKRQKQCLKNIVLEKIQVFCFSPQCSVAVHLRIRDLLPAQTVLYGEEPGNFFSCAISPGTFEIWSQVNLRILPLRLFARKAGEKYTANKLV